VVARLLAEAGRDVSVFTATRFESCSPDCQEMRRRAQVVVRNIAGPGDIADLSEFEVVVDAVYGTGFDPSRAVDANAPETALVAAVAAVSGRTRVYAVDIPSGLDATTGQAAMPRVSAHVTVALQHLKLGMFQGEGPDLAGDIEVADIGIAGRDPLVDCPKYPTREDAANWFAAFHRTAHKGDRGSVLCVGGSTAMPGSIALTAYAALRMGAGLSTCAVPEGIHPIVAGFRPEVMTIPLPDRGTGCLTEEAAEKVLALLPRYDVLALGPGVTTEPPVRAAIRRILERAERPVILDADGLNCLAESGPLKHHAPLVLTPHPGEMARLMKTDTKRVLDERFEIARKASMEFGATIVLKGAYTLICEDGQPISINPTGNPGLATAGSGDVLTGAIAALVHQTGSTYTGARAAVYAHGLAGDLLCSPKLDFGYTAMDIAAKLREARAVWRWTGPR
jgi:NAD(P)H-hydrate epimerase